MTYSIRSSIERKAAMYEMILAIENDFIENFVKKLSLGDIPVKVSERSNKSDEKNKLLSILQGLDFQSYIEICNSNILKLQINQAQKDFLNKELVKIIPIRNIVMHPRPLGILDYHIVKAVFEEIDQIFLNFNWENVSKTRTKIAENPQELRLPPQNAKKSERVIENIPTSVEFEETSFIGRHKEIGELKAKLNKRNVHILSIIGDGGIGKTAIAIKLLYDLLDDDKCKFDLILWASLKTNELNNYEFKEIEDSISDTSSMYEKLNDFVGDNNISNVKEYLISLAEEFSMLLVLDNLETINTGDIKEFLDDFTEYGKVLITSRIGLGEMEHRYRLGGLCKDDALEYMNTLLDLYGFEGMFSDNEKYNIASNELYSNPLAIKWFVRNLYNGQSVDEIIKNKEELATFCMSNVYDKLSTKAQNVLDVLVIAGNELSFAELMYYMDVDIDNYINAYKDVSNAVNELVKSNFIDDVLFRTKKKLSITDFAKEFLKCCYIEKRDIISSYNFKLKRLQGFLQKQLQENHKSDYAMKEFGIKSGENSKLVAAYYLTLALKESKLGNQELAFKYVEYAKKLEINYFQCNKIAAYLYGTTSQNKAKEEFEIALKCCEVDEDKVMVYIVYAGYLLRCNDYYGALSKLENAEVILDGEVNVYLIFEKSKILGCLNRFEEAYGVLDQLDIKELSTNYFNIFVTRKADLKRRESELFDHRDFDKMLGLIRESYEYLRSSDDPDRGIYQYMTNLVKSLAYLYYSPKANELMLEILDGYYSNIRKDPEYKKVQDIIKSKLENIEDPNIVKRIKKYTIDINEQLESLKDNEGLVYYLNKEKNFGFFRNKENLKGVYFKITHKLRGLQIGDVVKHGKINLTTKGTMTKEILSYYSLQ
ncbi:MAG: hypothetical protein JEZ08_06090 [Clostridiales bacterium]|nr:hypothetical protein [Clostridiales bacterium]